MKRIFFISLLFLTAVITGCAYWTDPWGPYPIFNPQTSSKAKLTDYFRVYQYDYPKEISCAAEFDNN
ncbi:MAG: hypothetical protein H7A34_05815 [bacterium]|nr:hypothetical protein [bacterium]